MPDLTAVLGQTDKSIEVLEGLREDDAVVWLHGPSGSGKTEIARLTAAKWRELKTREIYVSGDRDQRDSQLFPFYRAMKGRHLSKAVRQVLRQEGTAPFKGIPLAGNTLAFLVGLFKATRSPAPYYLSQEEADLISDLQSYAADYLPFLLVLDNIHILDDASCRFLSRLFTDDIKEAYPFAARLRILCVEADDQSKLASPEWLHRFRGRATSILSVGLPDRRAFPEVLKAMGLKRDLSDEAINKLHAATRGHLKVAQQIVRISNQNEKEAARLLSGEGLTTTVAKLLEARVRSIELPGGKLDRLLRIAACIGESFSHDELKCAFADPDGFACALDLALREEYLRGGEELAFVHEIIQQAFSAGGESTAYHSKLLECFKVLRPADYASRFRHAVLARNQTEAAQLAFAVRLQALRGCDLPRSAEFEAKLDASLAPLKAELDAYIVAMRDMDAGLHQRAVSSLSRFAGRDGIAGSEIKYLLALNYFKLRTLTGYKLAHSVLATAITDTDETELWCRLMSTQAVVLIHLGRMVEADKLRAQVIARLRKTNDPWARTHRMILHRQASVFMPPEPACGEIEAAAQYFAPPKGTETPRHPFQYAAALVNYSGVLFELGKYDNAAQAATAALSIYREVGRVSRTVELYKVTNNLAIAYLRGGRLTAAEAVEFMRLALAGEASTLDRMLFLNNLAVAEALSGDLDSAFRRLKALFPHVSAGRVDSYYYYVITSNFAAILHLVRKTARAIKLWRTLVDHIPRLPDYDREVLRFRQSNLQKAFKAVTHGDATGWDSFLCKFPPQFGESWFFYRNGLLLSDIQVWSES